MRLGSLHIRAVLMQRRRLEHTMIELPESPLMTFTSVSFAFSGLFSMSLTCSQVTSELATAAYTANGRL